MRNGRNEKNSTLDSNAVRTKEGAGPLISLLCLDGLDKILAYDLKKKWEISQRNCENQRGTLYFCGCPWIPMLG
jgi:hypothetical protein